jgi:hypothetical protein
VAVAALILLRRFALGQGPTGSDHGHDLESLASISTDEYA